MRRSRPRAADWSPAEDLGFDSHPSLGGDRTDEVNASTYEKLIAATGPSPDITMQVDVDLLPLESDVPDREVEEDDGQTDRAETSWPMGGGSPWVSWEPVPQSIQAEAALPLPLEAPTLASLVQAASPAPLPPLRRQHTPSVSSGPIGPSFGPPPRIVTPIVPDADDVRLRAPARSATLVGVSNITGPQQPLEEPPSPLVFEEPPSPGAFEEPPSPGAFEEPPSPAPFEDLAGEPTILLGHPPSSLAPERPSAGRRWVPILAGSVAVLVALGIGVTVLLAGGRRVAVETPRADPAAAERGSILSRLRQAVMARRWAEAEEQLGRLAAGDRVQLPVRLWEAQILAARGASPRAAASYRALLQDRRLGSGPLFAEAALGYARLLLALDQPEASRRYAEQARAAAAGTPSLERQVRELLSLIK